APPPSAHRPALRSFPTRRSSDLGATRAPLDGDARDRERERGAWSEQSGARKAAHRTHRDRTGVVDLERECLADADERNDREQAEEVLGGPREDESGHTRADPSRADHRDDDPEPDREGEEDRP